MRPEPSALALELGTDARTTRKFLRSITPKDAQPGKGSRWEIKKSEVRSLRKKFAEFTAAAEKAREAREAKTEPETETELEPTDDELEAIDAEG